MKILINFRLIKKKLCFFFTLIMVCTNSSAQNLTGKWKLNANLPRIGTMQILLNFTKTSDSSFVAESRPRALENIMSGIKYAIATKNEKFKNGAIIHIYNGVIIGDSLKGTLTTSSANFDFVLLYKNGIMTGHIGQEKHAFAITATPYNNEFINYDYIGLAKQIKKCFQRNIYDAELLNTKEWSSFFNALDDISSKAQDDLEMFLFFNFLIRDIKLSHISISKYNPLNELKKSSNSETIPKVTESIVSNKAGYLKFSGFQLSDSVLIRNFFKKIIAEQKQNLILDFRGCSGGDQSSMYLASYFTKEGMDAGFFIGNKYYQNNKELPDERVIENLPIYKAPSVKDFLQYLIDNGLMKGKVIPDYELHFKGKVYVLIDKKSASATEPIAYFLKQHHLATLVGETTAGKMVSSKVFTVKDEWGLLIPIADYYTSDRFRIEQNGVTPNIKVKTEEALVYVLKRLE